MHGMVMKHTGLTSNCTCIKNKLNIKMEFSKELQMNNCFDH